MSKNEMIKVDFFIVGAPKAGTTALHAYLDKHSQVCMSSVKEPNYFSYEEIEKQHLYYQKEDVKTESEYLTLFKCKEKTKIRGEASVSYLYYETVPGRIKKYNPNAKIIISLRHPVQRAFSHYQMDYSLGLVDASFEEIFRNGPGHPITGNYFQQYFLLSDYAVQLERYLNQFPKENICILLHEDLIHHLEDTLENVFHFLDIEFVNDGSKMTQENVTGGAKNKVIQKLYQNKFFRKTSSFLMSDSIKNKLKSILFTKKNLPTLDNKLALELHNYYLPGILRLKALTGLSIDHWMQISKTSA